MEKFKAFFTDLFKDRAKRWFVIALICILLGGFLGSMIQTNFYSVSISTSTIETVPVTSQAISQYEQTGKKSWSTADIYKPKSASSENKVPLILVAPGIQRTKETQASFCIELARRGYAVICIDPYAQGESSPSYESQSATNEGYGLFNWMDYLHSEEGKEIFDYIDYARIGATGHSAGGNGAQKLAEREGQLATDKKTESRIKGVYITGFIRDFSWKNTICNVGISYSKNDEGAFQNSTAEKKNQILEKKNKGETLTEEEEWWLTVGNADLRYAEESISLVNYQLKRAGQADIDEVEIGADYGNPYEGTYVIINNETALHSLQPYDSATLSNMIGFFDYIFEMSEVHKISTGSHIWWIKEVACGIALVGGFILILSLAVLLLRTPLFASLKKEIPARTGDQKIKGRIIFWVAFAVSAVLACVLYMVCVNLSTVWFPEATAGTQTWLFPQRFTNAVMLWAVINGLIGIAIFFLTWGLEYIIDYYRAKKQGAEFVAQVHGDYKSKLLPLKLNWEDVLKTLLLAAILIGAFFAADYIIYLIFHIDMRFFFISARVTFTWKNILAILMYLPFFFIFYFSNSLRVNSSMRPSNWKEWLSQLIAVLGNTLGLIAIIFMQYIPFLATGTIGFTNTTGPEWLFVNQLFSIIPMMAILPLMNRFFFNKTGRSWLGPIVTCVIFIAMMGGATTIYYMI